MVIAVDWDLVLHDRKHPVEGKTLGPPMPLAQQAMDSLEDAQVKVIVFSCVARTPEGRQAIIDWLDYFGMAYTEVTAIKPIVDCYIDDKGLHHKDWKTTINELSKRLKVEIEL